MRKRFPIILLFLVAFICTSCHSESALEENSVMQEEYPSVMGEDEDLSSNLESGSSPENSEVTESSEKEEATPFNQLDYTETLGDGVSLYFYIIDSSVAGGDSDSIWIDNENIACVSVSETGIFLYKYEVPTEILVKEKIDFDIVGFYNLKKAGDNLILSMDDGYILLDLEGRVLNSFIISEELSEQYSDSYFSYYNTISNNFQYFAFLNAYREGGIETGENFRIKYEIVLKDIPEDNYKVLLSGYTDETEDDLGKAPVCFTNDNKYLVFGSVVSLFEGMDGYGSGGGRISLEDGSIQEIINADTRSEFEDYEYIGNGRIAGLVDDDTLILISLLPPTAPLVEFGVYNFDTKIHTSLITSEDRKTLTYQNAVIIEDYNPFVLVNTDVETRLYNVPLGEYRVFLKSHDLSFGYSSAVSFDGRYVACCDLNEKSELVLTLLSIENDSCE